jgi:hypothetical protein
MDSQELRVIGWMDAHSVITVGPEIPVGSSMLGRLGRCARERKV